MRTLRNGMKGKDVTHWQNFLRGLNIYLFKVDGDFGDKTEAATKKFQKQHVVPVTGSKYDADGIVGTTTYGIAASKFGFELVTSNSDSKYGPNWPPKPRNLRALSFMQRQKVFGEIRFKSAGTKRNPEAIKITNNWTRENLTKVEIPQLKGIYGAPKSGKIFWHKKGADQIVKLFQAWEDEGLMDNVLSWAGSWVPRFIRGSRTTLSNHAHAVAFDINAAWNGLGRQPALVGRKGSVRELVPIAVEHGFFWGGFWSPSYNNGRSTRGDGMHFEICTLKGD